MVTDMVMDVVADMEVDKVADMEVDKVADKKLKCSKTKCIGLKLFDAKCTRLTCHLTTRVR